MADDCYPDFGVAMERFQDELRRAGQPCSIGWTFAEDYARLDATVYVRTDNLAENALLAMRLYQSARNAALGVEITQLAVIRGLSLCGMWITSDPTEAEYRLVSGLKFRMLVRPVKAVAVDTAQDWRRLMEAPGVVLAPLTDGLISNQFPL